MEIKDLKFSKLALEREVARLIKKFENETHLSVESIHLERFVSAGLDSGKEVVRVRTRVEL